MTISRRNLIKTTALVTTILTLVSGYPSTLSADENQPKRKPNFIIIFTDDQGYQDLGCFGSPNIKTPNLDRMAEEGIRFTNFYVGAPVCSASRAALMTGCYPLRVGVPGVFFPNQGVGLNPKEVTIADMLKKIDYATACIGKWHLGDDKPFLPTHQGFDSYYGIPYSNDMFISKTATFSPNCLFREGETPDTARNSKRMRTKVPLFRNDEVIEYPVDQSTLTQRYTSEAIKFIESKKDKPFFLYLANTMPHIPLAASKDFKGKSARGLYGDAIEEIDWEVGQIFKTLKDLDLDKNTLVIFTSDNGPWLRHGKDGGCALPLRDGKFTNFEGGQRVPCIMRWPAHIPAGKNCSEMASTIDILPTFADLSGAKVPCDRIIDGIDITKLITGQSKKSPRNTFFYMENAVRYGKWKLHLKARSTVKNQPAGKPPLLYDLSSDIAETKNLASEYPEVVSKLTKMLQAHKADLMAHARPHGSIGKDAAQKTNKH